MTQCKYINNLLTWIKIIGTPRKAARNAHRVPALDSDADLLAQEGPGPRVAGSDRESPADLRHEVGSVLAPRPEGLDSNRGE